MKAIWGSAGPGGISSEFPKVNGTGLINALPVGILGADGTAIQTAGNSSGSLFNLSVTGWCQLLQFN